MFEIFYVPTGEVMYMALTEELAWDTIKDKLDSWDYDIRLAEDTWPEYESVMEMEKYQ